MRKLPILCLLSLLLLQACTKMDLAKNNKHVMVTIIGTVLDKHSQKPLPDIPISLTRYTTEWDMFWPVAGTTEITNTTTDADGNYRITFKYEKQFEDVKLQQAPGTNFGHFDAIAISNDQTQVKNIQYDKAVVIKTNVYYYNNNYPPLTIVTLKGTQSYYSYDQYAKSNTVVLYDVSMYNVAYSIGFTDKNPVYDTPDSIYKYREHMVKLPAYADTLVINDTINALKW